MKSIQIPTSPELNAVLADLEDAYFVGGCVRDAILGLEAKDLDIEVHNLSETELLQILSKHGKIDEVGQAFGVIKLTTSDHETHDFSLPRRDSKTGKKHKDFEIEADPYMGTKEASRRRDYTINTIMVKIKTGEVMDHHNGIEDLQNGILRATDLETFGDDALRALRGFQFAARMGLMTTPETNKICEDLLDEFEAIPKSRIWNEWEKWATKSQVPSAGIRNLIQTGWIKKFPQIDGLENVPQSPRWHPEGNVLNHTLHCVDALAQDPQWQDLDETTKAITMLATLCHDLGKKTHSKINPKTGEIGFPGHEQASLEPTKEFLEAIGTPKKMHTPILALIENHMVYLKVPETNDLESKKLQSRAMIEAKWMGDRDSTLEELFIVMAADHAGRPPRKPELPKEAMILKAVAKKINVWQCSPMLPLKGADLLELGLKPGPDIGKLLEILQKHFLQKEFESKAEGIQHFKTKTSRIFQEAGILPKALISFASVQAMRPNDPAAVKQAYRETFREQLLGKHTNPEEMLEAAKKKIDQLPNKKQEPSIEPA